MRSISNQLAIGPQRTSEGPRRAPRYVERIAYSCKECLYRLQRIISIFEGATKMKLPDEAIKVLEEHKKRHEELMVVLGCEKPDIQDWPKFRKIPQPMTRHG